MNRDKDNDSKDACISGSTAYSHYKNKVKVPFSAELHHEDITSDEEVEKVKRVDWEKKKRERDCKVFFPLLKYLIFSLQKPKKSLEALKNEKQKHANFFYNVEAEKAKQKEDLDDMFEKHNRSANLNDQNVTGGINKQRERLRQKLEHKSNN